MDEQSKKSIEAAMVAQKILDDNPDIETSISFDDTEVKKTAIGLGVLEELRSQSDRQPTGSRYVLQTQNGTVYLLGYFWGQPEAKDNGYSVTAINLEAFKVRPNGLSLLETLLLAIVTTLGCDPSTLKTKLHTVWNN